MFEKLEKIFKKDEPTADLSGPLTGSHVAILACEGFEESELLSPRAALESAGAMVHIVSPKLGKIRSWDQDNWGKAITVDMAILDAFTQEFDFLMLPGGVINPDKLRQDSNAIAFAQKFINAGKPIAAICHGVQTLIETGTLKGRTLTSYPALRTDLLNAGATWVDKETVVDDQLLTSRSPKDLPAFNRTMVKLFTDYYTQHSLPNTESFVVTL